jgi:hypothetical protein
MTWHNQSLEIPRLGIKAESYKYRFCPRCRKELPAKHQSCPECVHWLGEKPLERTEWWLTPAMIRTTAPARYELIGASALSLRLVCNSAPPDREITALAEVIGEVITIEDSAACEVNGHGWLIWTTEGLRQAFRLGCELERRLVASLPRLQKALFHTARIRWGIWIDQYIVPFDRQNRPVIVDDAATAIFNFEPSDVVLSSEAVYQISRRWEHFVSVPRQLLDGQEPYGYRMIGHKRPSSLDHAGATHSTPFIGRENELSVLDDCWNSGGPTVKFAIIASAGSGKTRLMKEWLKRRPKIRALTANFSLFGGTVEEFAGQLAELPPDRLDASALVDATLERIHRDKISMLIMDDLHWAGFDGVSFIRRLLASLPKSLRLIILASRPSGQQAIDRLQPDRELKLNPLPLSTAEDLAYRLTTSEAVAIAAASQSNGNPLFVEQFIAWAAEANFQGGKSIPRTLHQIVAARIEHLLKVRVADIRQRLGWGGWWRRAIDDELAQLESEIGLWLDRLETGDYADRLEAARYLVRLECLDYEIFVISMVAGRPRPRSSRLREAIERLLIGSADQILADLRRRAARATPAAKEDVSGQAKRAADILFAEFNWGLAADFYELARSQLSHDQSEIDRRLAECRRRDQGAIAEDYEVYSCRPSLSLVNRPSVDALDLPYVWADLGRRFDRGVYFVRAAEAAERIRDQALAAWAKHKAADLLARKPLHPRG